MKRYWMLLAGVALGAAAWAASGYSFNINGKASALNTTEKGGVVYVDAVAFAKALGATVRFDKAKRAFTVTTPKAAPLQDVAGTAQLAGGDGVLGKTYSLGKGSLLNFTLNSVEYRVEPLTVGTSVLFPKDTEKLLVLHFTAQNPQKNDMLVNLSSFKFTAVDKIDVNHTFQGDLTREGAPVVYYENLKPAQKVSLMAAWTVPAAGPVPKLIVAREDGPVVRYDLRGLAKVPSVFADPADASGSTALAVAPGVIGAGYAVGPFQATVQSARFSTDVMEGHKPDKGKKYFVATIALKYAVDKAAGKTGYSWATLQYELLTSEGDRVTFTGNLLKPNRDARAEGDLLPGDEVAYRVYFLLDEVVGVKALRVQYGSSHSVSVNLSSVK